MIKLYTTPSPNCQKVAIMLEETGLPYETQEIALLKGEQKKPAYTVVNPNARVPAIFDSDTDLTLWDSGAILIYLADKTNRFLPESATQRALTIQWLMFQMSGIGPSQGGAHVFSRYVPDKIPWVIERFRRETLRLYSVLEDQLSSADYLAGEYSVADMAVYPWVRMHGWAGVSVDGLDRLQNWCQRVAERAAVERTKSYYEPDMSIYEGEEFDKSTHHILN